MTRFEMLEILIEELGIEKTLNALVCALSDDEMKDNFEYICRMYEIEIPEENDDEEDESED